MQRFLNTTNTEMDQNVALVIRRYNLSLLRQFAKRTANLNVRTSNEEYAYHPKLEEI